VTRLDLILAVLGLYLAAATLISAWQRSPRATGGVAPWVALSGLWTLGVYGRWIAAPWFVAPAAGIAWGALMLLLTRSGAALARRAPVRRWVWLLGPVHAFALAGLWLRDWRHRHAAARPPEAAASAELAPAPPTTEPMGEALESVVELGETTVDEVMVPRSEIDALPADATVGDWLRLARESRHPYLPVYGEDLDEIRGYLSLHDLFSADDPGRQVTAFLREARFVPESMRCDDLLRDLLAAGARFAIVVDEFGGTAGLVRERDLFEILLGEIDQESADRIGMVPLGRGIYLAHGAYRTDDFAERTGHALPEGDYETLGGLLLAQLGRIPEEGETVTVDDLRFEVVAANERRIFSLRILMAPGEAPPAPAGPGGAQAAAPEGGGDGHR
jgi:CBS domain containing-hemolysin-like protein